MSEKNINHRTSTIKEIKTICELISKGYTNTEICNIVYKSESESVYRSRLVTISNIRNGVAYKEIASEYRFPKVGEKLDGADKTYYPRSTMRLLTDDELEKIFTILIEKNGRKDSRVLNMEIAKAFERHKDNAGSSTLLDDITMFKYHISNGSYKDIYDTCAKKMGLPIETKSVKKSTSSDNHEIPSEEEIKQICELISKGYTNTEICDIVFGKIKDKRKRNSKKSTISKIRNGHTHKNISSGYVFPQVGETCSRTGITYYGKNSKKFNNAVIEEICGVIITSARGEAVDKVKKICEKHRISVAHNTVVGLVSRIRCGRLYTSIYNKYLKK